MPLPWKSQIQKCMGSQCTLAFKYEAERPLETPLTLEVNAHQNFPGLFIFY